MNNISICAPHVQLFRKTLWFTTKSPIFDENLDFPKFLLYHIFVLFFKARNLRSIEIPIETHSDKVCLINHRVFRIYILFKDLLEFLWNIHLNNTTKKTRKKLRKSKFSSKFFDPKMELPDPGTTLISSLIVI